MAERYAENNNKRSWNWCKPKSTDRKGYHLHMWKTLLKGTNLRLWVLFIYYFFILAFVVPLGVGTSSRYC